MRIGFDLRPFLKEETGVGIYFKNLLFSLSRIDRSNEYYLFSSSLRDRFSAAKIPPFGRKYFRDFRFPVKVVNFFWYRLSWPPLDYFFKTELDLTHSPIPLILPTKGKKIVTVHDLFFMDYPSIIGRELRKNFVSKIKDSLLEADGIVAVSQFTKNQLRERFAIGEKKVKVIYHGLDPKFNTDISADEAEKIMKKFSLPPFFILFVGAMEPRKNILNLVDALKIIHSRYKKIPLVVVGRRSRYYKNLEKKIKQNKLESWIRIMGYISDKELKVFYRLASVFAFPSRCEGFGFPLLEAMASSLPVVASQASAMPEIAQDAALYFHPEDPEDLADKIILALKDENLCQNLKAKGRKRVLDFDWNETAVKTLSFYKDIYKGS